jgi:paraquat-inducible protein A
MINDTYKLSKKYEYTYNEYSKTKTLNNNIEREVNNLIGSFIGMIIGKKEINNKIDKINYEEFLYKIKDKIKTNTLYIIILLIISMGAYFLFNKLIVISFLYIQSIIFLIYGLISPIFLMYVIQDIATSFIILQFESNSIITSIEKLFNQNNYFVGGIILLFSVIFPLLKTIISFVSLYIKNINILNQITNISSKLAKLSMTDIFVLSIFLVYLSPKNDGIIKTELEIGFFFFFIYVVISLFIAIINKKIK